LFLLCIHFKTDYSCTKGGRGDDSSITSCDVIINLKKRTRPTNHPTDFAAINFPVFAAYYSHIAYNKQLQWAQK